MEKTRNLLIFLIYSAFAFDDVLSVGQSDCISQESLWRIFKLNTSNIKQRYIRIDLILTEFGFKTMPILALRFNNYPLFLDQNDASSLISNYADLYSYENQLKEHSLIFDYKSLPQNSIYYLGIANPNYENSKISYILEFSQYDDYICASDCSNNGYCSKLDSCSCGSCYIGKNCGIHASKLTFKNPTQMEVKNNEIGYFEAILTSKNFSSDNWKFYINCEWSGEIGILYVGNPGNSVDELPNSDDYFSRLNLGNFSRSGSIMVDTSNFSQKIVLVSVWNTLVNSNNSLLVTCQLSKPSSSSDSYTIITIIWISIICIVLSLVIAILIFFLFRHQARVQVYDSNAFRVSGINQESIEKMYPSKPIKNVASHLGNICVICMEDFKGDSNVRKLNCGHIFHVECIDEWFKHHKACPMCKRDCEVPDIVVKELIFDELGEGTRMVSSDRGGEAEFLEIRVT
ncbi:unnamed protein product [Blepharisma stoltei]|uniref:RING-type domain-containing protein n=1 Tax=Blepharisma stoltei TaxID=1481888 RepID=A0AAU9IHY0_9CILI|nr:unnamed protein product [Blepharisma stoltei]